MALPTSHDVSGYIKTIEKTIENKTGVLMNPLKQTLQTYIKTLHAKGASKDYELASVMKKRDNNWYYELKFSCGATMTDEANYHVPGTPTLTSDSFSYCPFCGKPLNNPTMKGT